MNICKIMDDAGTFLAFGSQGGELAKIGTHKRPAVVRVRSFEKGEDIVALCNEHGWQVIVGVEEDEPEDTSDVEWLLSSLSDAPKVGAKPRLPPKSAVTITVPVGAARSSRSAAALPLPLRDREWSGCREARELTQTI